jgi:hypothetical protein
MKHIKEMDDLMKDLEGLGFTHKYKIVVYLLVQINEEVEDYERSKFGTEQEIVYLFDTVVKSTTKIPNNINNQDNIKKFILENLKSGDFNIIESGWDFKDTLKHKMDDQIDSMLSIENPIFKRIDKFKTFDEFISEFITEFDKTLSIAKHKYNIHEINDEEKTSFYIEVVEVKT